VQTDLAGARRLDLDVVTQDQRLGEGGEDRSPSHNGFLAQWKLPPPRYSTGVLAKYARLVTGAVGGLAVGYYLGTKASNERADQVERLVQRAKSSELADAAVDKAKAVVELGIERARDAINTN